MKLSKDQIKYIDDYLKHHKFKYWDIRFEVLDHIVNTVEDKMEQGITFDDAMIEVHQSFGNSMKMFWNTGIEYSIFANGDGYKNLIRSKKNELNKKYRNLMFKEFKNFFKSVRNTVLLLIFIMIDIKLFNILEHKQFLRINLLLFGVALLVSVFYLVKFYIKNNKSYNIEISQSQLTIFFTMFYLVSLITKSSLPAYISYSILAGYTLLSFIWFFTGLKVYRKTLSKYTQLYKELQLL